MLMAIIGQNCLIRNTDLAERIKKLIPILNIELGVKNGSPSFRQVYNELIDQTGAEIDLDTFADYYKSEIPADQKFTSDEKIDEIVDGRTKQILDNLANGNLDAIDGIGETSPERTVIHKIAGILKTLSGPSSPTTKTVMKAMQDAVLAGIQRMANSSEVYSELKQKNKKETFEETLERVLTTNSSRISTMEADKFNTVEDLFNEARDIAMERIGQLVDEDGEPILPEEALNFLEQYKNAVFGLMMSTSDASQLVRGSLIAAGYGKAQGEETVVDWRKLAGEINSPNVLRENVIAALQEENGLSENAAISVADALANEFDNAVQGQKAMNVKYSLAEAEATGVMDKLGWRPTTALNDKVTSELRSAIDESVENEEKINISEIVRQTMLNNGATKQQLANLPARDIVIQPDVADRIAKVVRGDGELDAEGLQKLYGVLGKVVDDQVINDLKKLSKLKDEVEATEITFDSADGSSKLNATKAGIEKAKIMKTISDQMARTVARGVDYSDKTVFQKFLLKALDIGSKYISTNASLVLLNPFNLTQNILSGVFTGTQAKVGGKVSELFSSTKTPLTYTDEDGNKHDLSTLLNAVGKIDTWFNTTIGEPGRDIPDLFSGDLHDATQTFQSAKTGGEKLEAALTVLPRAALSATDAMLKEPYFRRELIKGVLFYLQKSQGQSRKEAQKTVYEALTKNSAENLTKQAKQLASLVGKQNDKYYAGQVAEDIQLSSLMLLDEEGKSLLNESNLQAIIDAAKQVSSEAFGHKIQKNVVALQWFYDLFSGGKALAAEGINKEYGLKMAELYKTGEYGKAAWTRFTHNMKTMMGFLFQRGIYNWAVLLAQKNPASVITGFAQLSKQSNFHTQESTQESVENFLRSRAKIGRGVLGTASAMAIVPLVMSALGDDDDERRRKLAELKKDRVLGRLYNNFVPPFAQAYIDASLAKNIPAGVGTGLKDMLVQPVVSAGAKYYSVDNILTTANDYFIKGDVDKGNALLGQLTGSFLPGKNFIQTNTPLFERLMNPAAPDVVRNGEVVPDKRKADKPDDFWDAFWYSSIFKNK
jgi:hypothetical protein